MAKSLVKSISGLQILASGSIVPSEVLQSESRKIDNSDPIHKTDMEKL